MLLLQPSELVKEKLLVNRSHRKPINKFDVIDLLIM